MVEQRVVDPLTRVRSPLAAPKKHPKINPAYKAGIIFYQPQNNFIEMSFQAMNQYKTRDIQ